MGSDELDAMLAPLLDRSVDDLDKVELALLRLGAYELKHRIDVPFRVVIDEYVELARVFGAEGSFKVYQRGSGQAGDRAATAGTSRHVNEFLLIDQIVAALGDVAAGACVRIGPGDDAAVSTTPRGMELASSIDALVADVHFPAEAGPALIGYRAIMVSASDLAAMGAAGGFVLVALNLPEGDPDWARSWRGVWRKPPPSWGLSLIGGNIAAGPLAITVSVHGFAPAGQALTRAGAGVGDAVFVTGRLGGAAAAVARGDLASCQAPGDLDPLSRHYFRPRARIAEGVEPPGRASSAIDLSDGLLQDLSHIGERSVVGFDLESTTIPVEPGATLTQALSGGDDYELCFTMATTPPPLAVAVHRVGRVVSKPGIRLDGEAVDASGYQHFVG